MISSLLSGNKKRCFFPCLIPQQHPQRISTILWPGCFLSWNDWFEFFVDVSTAQVDLKSFFTSILKDLFNIFVFPSSINVKHFMSATNWILIAFYNPFKPSNGTISLQSICRNTYNYQWIFHFQSLIKFESNVNLDQYTIILGFCEFYFPINLREKRAMKKCVGQLLRFDIIFNGPSTNCEIKSFSESNHVKLFDRYLQTITNNLNKSNIYLWEWYMSDPRLIYYWRNIYISVYFYCQWIIDSVFTKAIHFISTQFINLIGSKER